MPDKTAIDVCILTYKRPQLLPQTLDSIARQDLTKIEIRVIVIDNDATASAEGLVSKFASTVSFTVIYDVEPIQNIARARNRAIDHVRADLFSFIDDDEIASITWLNSLLSTLNNYQAVAVFGPVFSIFPREVPDWAISHPVFNRLKRRTGEVVDSGACGNVLVNYSAIKAFGLRFDESFGKSGAEDTDFFYRLLQLGGKTVWCAEAEVTELVEVARLTKAWVLRRSYFGGLNFVRVVVKRQSGLKQFIWGCKKIGQTFIVLLVLGPTRLFSYQKYILLLSKFHANRGHLMALITSFRVPTQY